MITLGEMAFLIEQAETMMEQYSSASKITTE